MAKRPPAPRVKRAPRPRAKPEGVSKTEPSADCLSRYLSELQDYGMLDAEQERALAREIERLEISHFEELLSYRPALDRVASEIFERLPERPRKLAALQRLARRVRGPVSQDPRWARSVAAAARELRTLDVDRSVLTAADAVAHETFGGDKRARPYLRRVARARQAQRSAKSKFVTANLRLVISMATRCDRSLLPLADLIQEGNFGLMKAVERFDHRRGFRFSTYAGWWIRHALNRALSDKARLIRVPVHTLEELSRIARAGNAVSARSGRSATTEELVEQTGLSPEKVGMLRTRSLLKRPSSLDQPFGDEQDQSLHDVLAAPDGDHPERALDRDAWRAALGRLLSELPSIEAAVLRFRFGLEDGQELTLREIGDKYNLSRERIRQLQAQALRRLREAIEAERRRAGARQDAA